MQNNLLAISQDMQATNNCDEFGDGNDGDSGVSQICRNEGGNSIGAISQSNAAQGTEVSDISQITISQA